MDGVTTTANGYSAAELFNHLMYNVTGLSNKEHQFVLQNSYTQTGQWWVDVDYMIITAGDGDAS